MAELLDAGAALRQAQQDALAGQPGAARQLRTATAHLRAAITRLSARLETLLVRAGHAASDATLTRMAATLQAAATGDEATRAALAQDASRETWIRQASAWRLCRPRPSRPPPSPPSGKHWWRRSTGRIGGASGLAAASAGAGADPPGRAVPGRPGSGLEVLAASRQEVAQQAQQRAEQVTAAAQDLADQAAAAATAAAEARQAADAAERDADEMADRSEWPNGRWRLLALPCRCRGHPGGAREPDVGVHNH